MEHKSVPAIRMAFKSLGSGQAEREKKRGNKNLYRPLQDSVSTHVLSAQSTIVYCCEEKTKPGEQSPVYI